VAWEENAAQRSARGLGRARKRAREPRPFINSRAREASGTRISVDVAITRAEGDGNGAAPPFTRWKAGNVRAHIAHTRGIAHLFFRGVLANVFTADDLSSREGHPRA